MYVYIFSINSIRTMELSGIQLFIQADMNINNKDVFSIVSIDL